MNYAIILAAGRGNRMNMDIPKCAVPLLGKPMISYIIDELKDVVDETYVVLGYKEDRFGFINDEVKIAYQKEQLGSADACRCASNNIKDNGFTIIIPGDVPLVDRHLLGSLINKHINNKLDLTILTNIKDNPKGYGRIIRNSNNRIIKITEDIECNEEELKIKEINSGIMCIDNRYLQLLDLIANDNKKGEYYLTDIVNLMKDYNIDSYSTMEDIRLQGVNNLYELNILEEYLRNKINDELIKNGVMLENKSTITISKDSIISKGVIIKQGSYIINSIIKTNVVIGPNSQIINSYIDENTIINQSVISDSKINKGCMIGPFSHIRNNSNIGNNNRIGNFVEIKNSNIDDNTKASHLAYIGDTICGKNVNIGCGVITINYDGKKKSQTIIGDNSFIGCNSNLIAPINIGKHAFVAASTTLTESIGDYDFVISRSNPLIKKGYAKKYE